MGEYGCFSREEMNELGWVGLGWGKQGGFLEILGLISLTRRRGRRRGSRRKEGNEIAERGTGYGASAGME